VAKKTHDDKVIKGIVAEVTGLLDQRLGENFDAGVLDYVYVGQSVYEGVEQWCREQKLQPIQ